MKSEQEKIDLGARLTDEAIAEFKKLLNVELRHSAPPNTVATRDNIRHWAWGIGDDNPLWQDEDYAKRTVWGSIIAPPTFLHTFGHGDRGSIGLRGIHALWTEDIWEFLQPVRADDVIAYSGKIVDIAEKPSHMAGRTIESTCRTLYKNQRGEVVANYEQHMRRFERMAAHERGTEIEIVRKHYTKDEIKAIEELYENEEVRGATPRYWEDVKEGEEMRCMVKGPLTASDMVTFARGWYPSLYLVCHKMAYKLRKRHPLAMTYNDYGIPESINRVHYDPEFALKVGLPAAYDLGWQRVGWSANYFTNWMGDDAFLKKLHVQMRKPNFVGDTTYFGGKVAKKYIDKGEHVVECEFTAKNQREEISTKGWGTIRLPHR
jgi:acyl dehydratase